MYRVIKSYLFFLIIFVFAIQNAEAVSFKTNYKIVINNQQLGTLRRTINSEGHVLINLNLTPLSEAEASASASASASDRGIELRDIVLSGQTLSLNSIFHHLQLLLSGSPPAPASASPGNEISMTLVETTGQPSSITYNIQGKICHYSESDHYEDAAIFIGGQKEMYSFSPEGGFQVQPVTQTTPYSGSDSDSDSDSEADEGVEQTTTLQDTPIGDFGSLALAALSDAHGVEVTGQYFLFGQRFEQLLTTLVEGQNNNSGLLHFQSIFPAFEALLDEDTYEILPIGYGQELTYDPASHVITQQDPPDDPNPCGVITTYQLDSDGFITSIVVNEEGNAVIFSSEEITQSSEETGTPGSSDTSAPGFESAAYNLPFSSQLMSAFILILSFCQIDDQKNR